jgi:hypothetical protein
MNHKTDCQNENESSYDKDIIIEDNYYYYEALERLEQDIDEYLQNNYIQKITISAFQINNEKKYPFLSYLLCKNPFDDSFNLPCIPLNYQSVNTMNIITITQIFLLSVLNLENSKDHLDLLEFKGFYIVNSEMYIFYDLTKSILKIKHAFDDICFGLISEIVNNQSICNSQINEEVTNFFLNNSDFCFLKNKDNTIHELPVVCYVGKYGHMLYFSYIFGVSKSENNELFGPYYYFTNYENAIKQIGYQYNNINDINLKSKTPVGVIRFALFMEKIKFIQNLQTDQLDDSEIKKERLNDPLLDKNYEKLTMRISDHNGKWTKNYDSVFLGNSIELDNGEKMDNVPMIVLKEYEQQLPLSHHIIKL